MDERTTEILKRFSNSWTETEKHFDNLIENYSFEKLKPIRQFIKELKQKDGDKLFRLGTSIHILVLSRSVDNGLRADQKCLKIDAIKESDFEITLKDGESMYRQYRITDLGDIKLTKLLKTLKDTLVD